MKLTSNPSLVLKLESAKVSAFRGSPRKEWDSGRDAKELYGIDRVFLFVCLFVVFFFFTVECGNRSKMTPNSGVEDCGGDRGSDDPK